MIIGFSFILFFLRKSKTYKLSFFCFLFFYVFKIKAKQKRKPFCCEKNTSIKLALFTVYVSLLPRTCIITRPHDVDPPPSFPQSHTAKLVPTPHRILTPRNPKKKKQKPKRENKKKKRGQDRLTTSPQGAHCPEQPPLFNLTPTHP